MSGTIVIHSDFGFSHYVGEMCGIILKMNPDAKVILGANDLPPHRIYASSVILASMIDYYPSESVHVGVVDPGVGTDRDVLLLECGSGTVFVGPDNGLFHYSANRLGVENVFKVLPDRLFRLTGLKPKGNTFQGRDVFAPAAALYAMKGLADAVFEKQDVVGLEDRFGTNSDGIFGSVIFVDNFGNVITDIPSDFIEHICVRKGDIVEVEHDGNHGCASYSDRYQGEGLLLLPTSHDTLELAYGRKKANELLDLKIGSKIKIKKKK